LGNFDDYDLFREYDDGKEFGKESYKGLLCKQAEWQKGLRGGKKSERDLSMKKKSTRSKSDRGCGDDRSYNSEDYMGTIGEMFAQKLS
jgi:hypothetical protein